MKKFLIISFLIFSILINLISISYASEITIPDIDFTNTITNNINTNTSSSTFTITEEKLQKSFNQLVKDFEDDMDIKIDSTNKKIIFHFKDNTSHEIYYDLTNKPTFYSDVTIEEGISYEEYDKAI